MKRNAELTLCRLPHRHGRFPVRIATLALLLFTARSLFADECVWIGAGANELASTPANWMDDKVPNTSSAIVILNGTSSKDMTWDLTNPVAGWEQQDAYTGTVTIPTTYDGAFTEFHITGNLTIEGGVWTHPYNTSTTTAVYRLNVRVDGNLTLGPNAVIDLHRRGLHGYTNSPYLPGGSHGGEGGVGTSLDWQERFPAYGCPFEPMTLGQGGDWQGGGAVRLRVDGTAAVDGVISARGGARHSNYAGAAGGSISVSAGTLEGEGLLDASGGDGNGAGGGGRIAILVTNATEFGQVRAEAFGGTVISEIPEVPGAAGTVYRQSTLHAHRGGILTIDNHQAMIDSPMTPLGDMDTRLLEALVVTNRGVAWISDDTIFDFSKTNLHVYGAHASLLAIQGTNHLIFPETVIVSNYTLLANTPIRVPGNLWVAGNGVLSHSHNATQADYRMDIEIDGNLTVASGGNIDVNIKGYRHGSGPGAGHTAATAPRHGASHGGLGHVAAAEGAHTYGAILDPVTLGSGGSANLAAGRGVGGGAIRLVVHGTGVLHGAVSANARAASGNYPGGAGGSISIRAGELQGDAMLEASGGWGHGSGGGGRIALVVTNSMGFDQLRMQARGGDRGGASGAAGTIYLQDASQAEGHGIILIDNHVATADDTVTHLPASLDGSYEELRYAAITLTNYANASIQAETRAGNLFQLSPESRFYLNGHDLWLRSLIHDDWGPEQVVYDGGMIHWLVRGSMFMFR